MTLIDVDVNAHAAAAPTLLVALGALEALTIVAGLIYAMRRR